MRLYPDHSTRYKFKYFLYAHVTCWVRRLDRFKASNMGNQVPGTCLFDLYEPRLDDLGSLRCESGHHIFQTLLVLGDLQKFVVFLFGWKVRTLFPTKLSKNSTECRTLCELLCDPAIWSTYDIIKGFSQTIVPHRPGSLTPVSSLSGRSCISKNDHQRLFE